MRNPVSCAVRPRRTRVVVAVALATLAACGRPVRTERAGDASFSGYRTYAWSTPQMVVPPAGFADAAQVETRIRRAVDRELAAKGYRLAGGEPPSLLVDAFVKPDPGDASPYAEFFRGRPVRRPAQAARAYVTGDPPWTIAVAIVDRHTQDVAYRAAAPRVAPPGADGAQLDRAVAEMLAPLPPAGR